MLSPFASLTTLTSFLAVVSATPFNPLAGSCNPSLGPAVSILDGSIEWGVSPVVAGTLLSKSAGPFKLPQASPNWHVEQTGSYYPLYFIKALTNTSLAVAEINGELGLQQWDPKSPNQIFAISCNSCSCDSCSPTGAGKIASGCSIKHAGNCVAVEHGGDHFQLIGCASSVLQEFDFWTSTAN